MSRLQPHSPSATPKSASPAPSDHRGELSEQPSSSTHPRVSEGSEGYPSWLPRRPPPPDPGSTVHSSNGQHTPGLTPIEPFNVGRKPTPRSVRVVSLQDAAQPGREHREITEQARFPNPLRPRVWSRATTAGMTPTLVSAAANAQDRAVRPKFRSNGLHPELLRNPTLLARLYFYLLPLFTFYHIPLQTFFDFNAVFILLEVTEYPNPIAPGVSGSGKDWALASTAYIACWLVWILIVFVLYELVYSFYRRWRVKRPHIIPLYLSSSAFSLTSMTSYTYFSFMQYIRYSAIFGENGGLRDGFAETFWFYSQNLPTVALLLPRAGLCVALLLSFSSANPEYVGLIEAGFNGRDTTFFRASDGTLTDYARGVLFANAAWTAWRTLVLLISWIGLWILSGQGCGGFCGPRYRWEEEDHEKTWSIYSDGGDDPDALPWNWRTNTRLRIQEAFDFCLTVKPPTRWSMMSTGKKEEAEGTQLPGVPMTPSFEVEQVLAAVGLPSVPPPARRGALSEDLFARPAGEETGVATVHIPVPELSDIIPKVVKRSSKDREIGGPSAPLMKLPYPFSGYGAQVSSKDRIPFPPSPSSRKEKRRSPVSSGSERQQSAGSKHAEEVEVEDNEEEEEGEEGEEEDDEEEEDNEDNSEAQPRTSGSMSSLGQPITSRYPFQFRRPHARGASASSSGMTHSTPQSDTSPSSNSRSTQSTGNRDTSSESPMSHAFGGSTMSSPTSGYGSPIPMPPRHPQPGRGRARAGTMPAFPSSPSPVMFPAGRMPTRIRAESGATDLVPGGYESFLSEELDEDEDDEAEEEPLRMMMEQPEPEGPHEAAEGEDSVGLLSVVPRSPRSSNVSSRRRRGRHSSQSGSQSRSDSVSSRSRAGSAVRSRTQSLIQSLGNASRSSVELVQSMRSRANSSVARQEEDMIAYSSSSSPSYSGSASHASSSHENYTFGQPMLSSMRRVASSQGLRPPAIASASNASVSAPSEATTSRLTVRRGSSELREHELPQEVERTGMLIPQPSPLRSEESRPDISTAAQSFITAPATIAGTTDSGETGPTIWREATHMVDRPDSSWRPA